MSQFYRDHGRDRECGNEVKLYGPDDAELMVVTSLEREADQLLIRGTVFGVMPITARLDAGQARAALRLLLRPRLLLFVLTLPFRRGRRRG
jgi:hypothetical protein